MLPGIRRPTKKEYIGYAADYLARLAMGAVDGNRRGSRFPPTATRCATYFANAVGKAVDDPNLGPAYSATLGHGATVEELFETAAGKLEADLVVAAHEVLAEFYLRIRAEIAEEGEGADVSRIVADVLVRDVDEVDVDGDGTSLWVLFMQACYPTSPYLLLALRHDPHANSSAEGFAPWKQIPGVY